MQFPLYLSENPGGQGLSQHRAWNRTGVQRKAFMRRWRCAWVFLPGSRGLVSTSRPAPPRGQPPSPGQSIPQSVPRPAALVHPGMLMVAFVAPGRFGQKLPILTALLPVWGHTVRSAVPTEHSGPGAVPGSSCQAQPLSPRPRCPCCGSAFH